MKKVIQSLPNYKNCPIAVLRLDLLNPYYGGNKYYKLKHNVSKAIDDFKALNQSPLILTFGGAHSNHIYATAAYCAEKNINCVFVIRGEESNLSNSPTLLFAKSKGMILHFVSREAYNNPELLSILEKTYGKYYLIPEGGNNELGIKGCSEILDTTPDFDYVFCAAGTACTYTGLLSSAKSNQKIIGISVLKGDNVLIDDVNTYRQQIGCENIESYTSGNIHKSTIISGYHFGGYAKHTQELLDFKSAFESETNIPLDYVYTAKLFFAVYDLINKNAISEKSSVLVVHSGGQQGNEGYEKRYKINV